MSGLLLYHWLFSTLMICSALTKQTEKSDVLQHLEKCELETLRLGSDIADVMNSPLGSEGWSQRVYQDFIIERLGFAPFMSKGIHGTNGLTSTGNNAKALHERGNWSGKSIESTPYHILNKKWIYMFGDSTTRQIWASFASPFQGNNFERNSKEWTRQYCASQGKHRFTHGKFGTFPQEGWRGPCGKNEVTCHVSGYGEEGLLTYDWKHFPYEDYDRHVWSEDGPWKQNVTEIRPDILTVQFGLHTCWHAHTNTRVDTDYSVVNNSLINAHIDDIKSLMSSIRTAIDRPGQKRTQSVVIVTSGSIGVENGSHIDECILRVNRVAADEAHKRGFAVLERGEIERRLMHKSRASASPFIKSDMHLAQPVQSVISTCLLKLITCLDDAGFNINGPDIPSLISILANTQPSGESVGAHIVHVPQP